MVQQSTSCPNMVEEFLMVPLLFYLDYSYYLYHLYLEVIISIHIRQRQNCCKIVSKNEGLSISCLGVFFPTSPRTSLILWRHMDHFWQNFAAIWSLFNVYIFHSLDTTNNYLIKQTKFKDIVIITLFIFRCIPQRLALHGVGSSWKDMRHILFWCHLCLRSWTCTNRD